MLEDPEGAGPLDAAAAAGTAVAGTAVVGTGYGVNRAKNPTFSDDISRDAGLSTVDLRTTILDRDVSCDVVQATIGTVID